MVFGQSPPESSGSSSPQGRSHFRAPVAQHRCSEMRTITSWMMGSLSFPSRLTLRSTTHSAVASALTGASTEPEGLLRDGPGAYGPQLSAEERTHRRVRTTSPTSNLIPKEQVLRGVESCSATRLRNCQTNSSMRFGNTRKRWPTSWSSHSSPEILKAEPHV